MSGFILKKHLRGFCGLFPRRADSGGVERAGQTLTQGGNNRIKQALYLAADTARKTDPELAELYWRLMTVKGHHHKQALWGRLREGAKSYAKLRTRFP
ncbi:transposase (plasmid) [Acetobacter sp. AC2005]|uniref:transposase n=1 Tax=Acetobacter sp. AC2005 TaxID=3134142 RepID=UPI0030D0078E